MEPPTSYGPGCSPPHIAILMGTYNGADYLHEQLQSIAQQAYANWSLWVSDDGSLDHTLDILKDWKTTVHPQQVNLIKGPGQGFAKNFLSLVCNPVIKADYYAYADQDDIWLPHKLAHAESMLKPYPASLPALYCSRTMIIHEDGREYCLSKIKAVKPSFPNAIIQNIASGNTMVFNNATRELLRMAGPNLDIYAHDWWTYLAVMAAQGITVFDEQPSVKYRQHDNNQVGATVSLPAMLQRTRLDRNGRLRQTIDQNIAAIHAVRPQVSPANLALVQDFEQLRCQTPIGRIRAFLHLPFKRQSFLGSCSLALAAWLGRI